MAKPKTGPDRKQRRRAKAKAQAETESQTLEPQGKGITLADNGHLRAESRKAARLISLGVIDEEQAKQILAAGFSLAAGAAARNECRNYAAVMKVFVAVAQLERNAEPQQIDVNLNAGINYDKVFDEFSDVEILAIRKLDSRLAAPMTPPTVDEAR